MTPLSLELSAFRSFRGGEFDFPSQPGLYFMTGDNRVEPRLGANGAGKTTLWEAWCWALYGRTSRGLKAGDVCSWGAGRGTRVNYAFEAPTGEGAVCLTRQWGPNKHEARHLALDSPPEDLSKADDFVLGWLGLSYDQFLQCVYMAQRAPMFLDLKAEPKAALLAGVLGLDSWIERSAEASRRAAAEDERLRRLERELSAAEGRLSALEGQDAGVPLEAWERRRAEQLDELDRKLLGFDAHSTAREDLEHAKRREDEAFDEMRKLPVLDDGLRGRLKELRDAVAEAGKACAVLEDRLEDADDQLRRAQRGEDCRECGQPLGNAAHLREAKRRWESREAELEREKAHLDEARNLLAECEKEMGNIQRAWASKRDAAQLAQEQTRRAQAALDREEDEIRALEKEYQRRQREENPHRGAAERAKGELRAARRALDEAKGAAEASSRRHSLLALWARGFKEVRLQEMSAALGELEVEVNSACATLGLVGWEIGFHVDRETKSGSLSRGFSASVRAPGAAGAVPWEAWSGGESQRLRLAAQMGLADLVRSRMGVSLGVEVWDEPTTGLSREGTLDLLEALARRAADEGRQIWVVDHHAHSFGGFAGGAVVVKDADGSRVEQW